MCATVPTPESDHPLDSPPTETTTEHRNEKEITEVSSRWDAVADKLDDMLSGPRWARIGAGILILTVAAFVSIPPIREAWYKLKHPDAVDSYPGVGTHDPSRDAPGDKVQTAEATAEEVHLNYHLTLRDAKLVAGPELLAGTAGTDELQITYFSSDHCVRVHRHHNGIIKNKWVKDFDSKGAELPIDSADLLTPKELEEADTPSTLTDTSSALSLIEPPVVQASLHLSSTNMCLNPHPGPFSWWWGPANGCWVPMYRQFQDGCTHYQMFNSCGNYWDANVTWTACFH